MKNLKVGDLVTWNIKKGVNPKGKIIFIMDHYEGDNKYKVEAVEDISYKGRFGDNHISKGEILYPYNLRKV